MVDRYGYTHAGERIAIAQALDHCGFGGRKVYAMLDDGSAPVVGLCYLARPERTVREDSVSGSHHSTVESPVEPEGGAYQGAKFAEPFNDVARVAVNEARRLEAEVENGHSQTRQSK